MTVTVTMRRDWDHDRDRDHVDSVTAVVPLVDLEPLGQSKNLSKPNEVEEEGLENLWYCLKATTGPTFTVTEYVF